METKNPCIIKFTLSNHKNLSLISNPARKIGLRDRSKLKKLDYKETKSVAKVTKKIAK